MKLKLKEYSFKEFLRHFKHLYPSAWAPKIGCWEKAIETCKIVKMNVEDICNYIRKAEGIRAQVIYCAKRDGWWIGDACADIKRAPGDRAWAIICAKSDGWWIDDVS